MLFRSDFIVRRADDIYAYHLATVVDDADIGVTDIVRGADLLPSTGPQLWLADVLEQTPARYAHVPVLTDPEGRKLSKQNHAPATMGTAVTELWRTTLQFLGFDPPAWDAGTAVEAIQTWAVETWAVKYAR